MVSADFRTQFNDPFHDAGEYKLIVKCNVNNPLYLPPDNINYDPTSNQPLYNEVSFELGFSSFSGAIYNYNVPTP
jgi:hypothetical protein